MVQRLGRDNVEICLNSTCPAASDLLTFQLGNRNPIEFISSHYTNQFDRTPFIDIDKNSQDVCMNCHSKGSNRIDWFWFVKVNQKSKKKIWFARCDFRFFFNFWFTLANHLNFYSDAIWFDRIASFHFDSLWFTRKNRNNFLIRKSYPRHLLVN